MTIRRQYSLPNCTLILEGLNDGTATGAGQLDPRPLMTMLVNAECRFAGTEHTLSGGRDFLESLVMSVNRYAQEFLSQLSHPKLPGEASEIVQLQKNRDNNLHRLIVLPSTDAILASAGMLHDSRPHSATPNGKPMQVDLTTVQLFDLVEAIDQFLADRRTLPDINVPLEPLSRRYRRADQPMAKRAAPAALGMASLAVAAIAFFLVPVPQVREPKPSTPQENSGNTASPSPDGRQATATPNSSSPSPAELEKALTTTQEITDPAQLLQLQQKLYDTLDPQWKNRGELNENLEYRVGVGKDGAIVGYKPANRAAAGDATQKTPLPDLLNIPVTGSIASSEPIADFRVAFSNRGILQISPWKGWDKYRSKPSSSTSSPRTPEITDTAVLESLNSKLYQQIQDNWKERGLSQDLDYRVGVTKEGEIAEYVPINPAYEANADQTPLKSLTKPEATSSTSEKPEVSSQQPLAQFRVVFRRNGVLEVSPYRGYR
ncbi:MAG: DUF4335 domain-containing protein [Coleofasciculus sp. Co-bin14]|nr:DUF4335 domain-containing protein [Coleofasciculus sp. Co-bin14]